jgi:hypothetical protein
LCGDSQIGGSHANGFGSVNISQDAGKYIDCNDFAVVAVADGVSTSKHSDKASIMAVEQALQFCADNVTDTKTNQEILKIIKSAFEKANLKIIELANGSPKDFCTTLTLAVFRKGTVYYGHAGDGGIIALRSDGLYECVTEQQNAEGSGRVGPVYTLAHTDHWVFGEYQYATVALFLMTDGVWNKIVPSRLEQEEHKLDHWYLSSLYTRVKEEQDENEYSKILSKKLADIDPREVGHDDKTLFMVVDIGIELSPQPEEYYHYPSNELWTQLANKEKELLNGPMPTTPANEPEDECGANPLASNLANDTGLRNDFRNKNSLFMFVIVIQAIIIVVLLAVILESWNRSILESTTIEPFTAEPQRTVSGSNLLENEPELSVVVPIDIATATINTIDDQQYTGSEVKPIPVVISSADGSMLVQDIDFTCSYVDNVELGTAQVKIFGIEPKYTGENHIEFSIKMEALVEIPALVEYDPKTELILPLKAQWISNETYNSPPDGSVTWYKDEEHTNLIDPKYSSSLPDEFGNGGGEFTLYWRYDPFNSEYAVKYGKTDFRPSGTM